MQLRSPSEQTFLPCLCAKQLVDGETMWPKHHMFLAHYDTKTKKKDADYYFKKLLTFPVTIFLK